MSEGDHGTSVVTHVKWNQRSKVIMEQIKWCLMPSSGSFPMAFPGYVSRDQWRRVFYYSNFRFEVQLLWTFLQTSASEEWQQWAKAGCNPKPTNSGGRYSGANFPYHQPLFFFLNMLCILWMRKKTFQRRNAQSWRGVGKRDVFNLLFSSTEIAVCPQQLQMPVSICPHTLLAFPLHFIAASREAG